MLFGVVFFFPLEEEDGDHEGDWGLLLPDFRLSGAGIGRNPDQFGLNGRRTSPQLSKLY
jgi:hypothetical protein